jgi:hypothetical protein
MEKYHYYEIEFKGKHTKQWHHLTIEHELKLASKHQTRLVKMGHNARILRVDVDKNVISAG